MSNCLIFENLKSINKFKGFMNPQYPKVQKITMLYISISVGTCREHAIRAVRAAVLNYPCTRYNLFLSILLKTSTLFLLKNQTQPPPNYVLYLARSILLMDRRLAMISGA
jgi:hypothetical protein